MNAERLARLHDFLREEPDDPFTLYAIATEYATEDGAQARVYYEKLLNDHPGYVATYYHAAQLYQDLEEPALAGETYKKGIAVAQAQNDRLALRELQSAYDEFLFDE